MSTAYARNVRPRSSENLILFLLIFPFFIAQRGEAQSVPQGNAPSGARGNALSGVRATAASGGQIGAGYDYWPDSLRRELAHATSLPEKAKWDLLLAQYYFAQDSAQSEVYGRQAVEAAEMSRDRMVMIRTYIGNGQRYLQTGDLTGSSDLALENFHRAEDIAREEKLDEGLVLTDCALADGYRQRGDYDRALAYCNQAVALVGEGDKDTLQVLAYSSLGRTYERRNEKLAAFRNYLKALNIAEQSKKDTLIRSVTERLAYFYQGIRAYDKAIDYGMRTAELDRRMGYYYNVSGDYEMLGDLYTNKKEYDIALGYFEREHLLGDSIHLDVINISAYFHIFSLYLDSRQYQKGMTYLNDHPLVMNYFDHAGLHFYIDECYGEVYMQMRKLDSAAFYFRRAEPQVDAKAGPFRKADLDYALGDFYRLKSDLRTASLYFLKERAIGQATGDLKLLRDAALNLDSLYWQMHEYQSAYTYHVEYVKDADSLRNLSRETDLLKLEVDNDNLRRDREAKEEEQATEHRHNVQYMGFTVGLVLLFIVLVMMGWLAVPPSVIRTLGFLSFIFLFEFIILLTDKQIQGWTNEEPWKVLLIKIALAAILVPLHHWLEHKVIVYLSNRKRFKAEHSVKGVAGAHEAPGAVGH
jgi:tetratricopeptide (TPR) repeat protein